MVRPQNKMAALIRRIRPKLSVISQLKRPALMSTQCSLYSSTTKKHDQSEFVVGHRTEIDPKRVKEIMEEGIRAAHEQDDPNSPYYISKGFSDDPHADTILLRTLFFIGISLCFVIGPLWIHYVPDKKRREWAHREAVKVLAERREKGLPLIDPDFVPRDKIILPEN